MKTVLILNKLDCHYEIIESVIVKINQIFNINSSTIKIHLKINNNDSFKSYIKDKYPDISFGRPEKFDYYINCSIYNKTCKILEKTTTHNKRYIAHEVTPELEKNENVLFVTPLAKRGFFSADVLPFSEQVKKGSIPIYVIQGNLNQGRRNYNLLIKILSEDYDYDFKIKLIGRGNFPKRLQKYRKKIILKNNLDFIPYHKEFLNTYCILPLISKNSHPHYYTNKLTSTINYSLGYNLKCLMDKDLQDIYNLPDVEIYKDESDIVDAFKKTLNDFYEKK
jgi:hypothetical protein